jgi:predicted transcriptional regulator of viral defense system
MQPSTTKPHKVDAKATRLNELSVPAANLDAMAPGNSLTDWRLAGIRTAAELKAAGNSPAQISRLVRQGKLVRLRYGVYANCQMVAEVRGQPGGNQLLEVAASLASAEPGAVASHESAACIHAIDVLSASAAAQEAHAGIGTAQGAHVWLTVMPGRNRTGRGAVHIYSADLPKNHVTEVYGIPVTTPARTVLDLARSREFRAGVVAADSALHQKLITKADLESVRAHCSRWRGATRAAEVFKFADALSESVLESLARVVFRDCGLPAPELQVWAGGAEVVGRVDFLWRRYRTVAEVDGRMKYANSVRAVRQLERDRHLRDAGYEVVHFTWPDITQNPGYVNATIRKAFRRGMPSLPAA